MEKARTQMPRPTANACFAQRRSFSTLSQHHLNKTPRFKTKTTNRRNQETFCGASMEKPTGRRRQTGRSTHTVVGRRAPHLSRRRLPPQLSASQSLKRAREPSNETTKPINRKPKYSPRRRYISLKQIASSEVNHQHGDGWLE